MKAGWQYVINTFLCTLSFIAIQSCFPCKHCREDQCMLPGPGVAYSNDLPDNFTEFSSSPQIIPLKRKKLHEISGIAASIKNKNVLYLNQDNGHPHCIYLTNTTGEDLGRLVICNSSNRDWEDMAVGPGPMPDRSYIYVADIGDNNAWHCNIRIYRFPEPELTTAAFPVRKLIKNAEAICLQYPDRPHNAETILIDPLTRNLYIATKEDDSSRIYVASFPQSTRHKIMLESVITLPFRLVTGGTISSNGREVFLRSEDYYWYWKRAEEESITAALSRPPQQITPVTKEPQGEAICFATNQQGYFTCSEVDRKQQPVIYFYKREF
ncbi:MULTISPECIES: hypothetical protein [Niastella]|uniref:SMP-30/Gluconolactonase/LRE-like region domain-containing protein n=1 Tax=Niastella soli TaxID=2821487 RepID=A0ABS3YY46_9BACT|nr:hypothetical protein [Niastella soli]MBO9202847.1 hypothetical protein [Niastella soli]